MDWAIILLVSIWVIPLLLALPRFFRKLKQMPLNRFEAAFRKACRALPLSQSTYRRENEAFSFQGNYLNRNVVIEYRKGTKSRYRLEIEFRLVQKFWLRLVPMEDARLDATPLDDRFQIDTDQPEAAKEFLSSSFVSATFSQLPQFDKMEIYKGRMKTIFFLQEAVVLGTIDFDSVLNALNRIAHFYEIQSKHLKVLFALPSNTACPYCREAIDSESDAFSRCEKCGVLLHEVCRHENGQCTTWGCTGTFLEDKNNPYELH